MPVEKIKVVIVGQDPYPQPGVATGLAFAVKQGEPVQPSLSIIQTELAVSYFNDITYYMPDTSLESWEDQGVLLLNSSLSCKVGEPEGVNHLWFPESHSFLWRMSLMEYLFKWMNDSFTNLVFAFMGSKAQYYNRFIDHAKHGIINTIHPVADYRTGSRLFVGSKVFNNINEKLKQYDKKEISW